MFIVIASILAVSQLIGAQHIPYQPFGTYGQGNPGGHWPPLHTNNLGSNYGGNYPPHVMNFGSNYESSYPTLQSLPSSDNFDGPPLQPPSHSPGNFYNPSMTRLPVQPRHQTGPKYFLVSRPSSPNYELFNGNGGFTGGNERTFGGLNYGTRSFCDCFGCPSCVYPATGVCFNTPNGPFQNSVGDLMLDRNNRNGLCTNRCKHFFLPQQKCCQFCESKAF